MELDAVDREILRVLREDGRASHTYIARRVKLSAPAVRERIRKLEQAGVVTGYRAVLDPGTLGLHVTAFVWITPQPRKPAGRLVERLTAMPEIEQLHAVAGSHGFLALVRVGTTQDLDSFLDQLFMLEGVERTETTMVLRTNLDRPFALPEERGA